jgi:hypothetical protein
MAKGVWGFLKKVGLAEEVPGEQGENTVTQTTPVAKEDSTATGGNIRAQGYSNYESAEEKARRTEIDHMVRQQLVDSMESAGAPLIEFHYLKDPKSE